MAGLQEILDDFEAEGVQVVAVSADDREGAETMKREGDLTYPILFGMDVDDGRDRFGLYVQKGDRTHLQPAQFIVRPDGAIALACYSSGKVGRLDAEEALDAVRSAKG